MNTISQDFGSAPVGCDELQESFSGLLPVYRKTSLITQSPPDNRRLNLQLNLLDGDGLKDRGSGRIFNLTPYRSQWGQGFHLSCATTGQPFAGVWTAEEVSKIKRRITYSPVSVPEFMAIAASELFGGGAE